MESCSRNSLDISLDILEKVHACPCQAAYAAYLRDEAKEPGGIEPVLKSRESALASLLVVQCSGSKSGDSLLAAQH